MIIVKHSNKSDQTPDSIKVTLSSHYDGNDSAVMDGSVKLQKIMENLPSTAELKIGGDKGNVSIPNSVHSILAKLFNEDTANYILHTTSERNTYCSSDSIIFTIEGVESLSGQPNNEIWYTTTDGNIFTTYTDDDNHTPIVGYKSFLIDNSIFDETNYVGPSIISETYEDGVWKVKFASDLTTIGSFNNGGNVYPYFATGDPIDNLKTVSFPSSVTSIGGTFWANINLTSITIREGVTTIGDMVFAFSLALTDLTLPASLTSIGEYVFYSCESLTTLNYAGTKEQWYNITKASDWMSDSSITTVHCSDGDLTGQSITVKPVFDTNTDINYDTFDELFKD